MDIMTLLLAPVMWPTSGLWEAIIKWFAGIGNVAIAIILLTLVLKIVLLPLDFWQKMVSRKMTTQQALIQPEIEEIKRKYANNPTLMQQKQAEVYKKHNMSPTSSCLAMLVYMVVTMVVFFTLFSGLGNISRTQINYEYYTIEQTYRQVYEDNILEPDALTIAQNAATEKYEEIKQSFLSIKNVWRPDNWSNVFPNADEFVSSTRTNFSAFKYEPANVIYLVLTTDGEIFKDKNGNEYLEPYMDLSGNVYAVFDTSTEATNPASFTIETADGDKVYNDVVYTQIFRVYENVDLGISYYYLTKEVENTYKKDTSNFVMPYVKDGKIFATTGSLTEVQINGKTYQVENGKTQDEMLVVANFEATELENLYKTSSATNALTRFKADYSQVTAGITEKYKGQWNGFLVLIALAGIITFLSTYLSTAGVKAKDPKGNELKRPKQKPTMGIILSVVMILFTISYTSVFALYIITNSVVSMIFTYLSNLIINKIETKKENKDVKIADYVRR